MRVACANIAGAWSAMEATSLFGALLGAMLASETTRLVPGSVRAWSQRALKRKPRARLRHRHEAKRTWRASYPSYPASARWQAWHEYEQTTTAAPGWDVEAGLGPRKSTKSIGLPSPGASAQGQQQDAKLMDTADVNSFLAPCPPGPSSGTAAHSPAEADPIMLAEPVLAKEGARGIKASSCAPGPAGCMPVSPSTEVKAAVSVDIDSDVDHGALPSTQGRAYDLNKVDEKLRKRLLKNRLFAERSRQRKQAHVEHLEFELSCCRSENEHLKKKVASLEAQVAALSLNTGCKPATAFNHQELTAVS